MTKKFASATLPAPGCAFGYPDSQLVEMWNEDTYKNFMRWMRGQTFSSCSGEIYDHSLRTYLPSGCGPHGFVYYSGDVLNFLDNQPVTD